MTPEDYERLRRRAARTAVTEFDEEWRLLLEEALVEIDRLRRLPVVETCGECGHVGFGDYCSHQRFDGLEKHDRPELSHNAAPPEWCPLRGGSR
ncbi:MAG: hypothetical protein ACRCSL_16675 [Microbacterium sp.]